MFDSFREFLTSGGAIDLVVALILGAALVTIIGLLTGRIIMPVKRD